MKRDPVRYKKYERLVRRIRQRIFDYPPEKEEKAGRVLRRAIGIMFLNRAPDPVDKWGATANDRRMLARHGMAWGD